LRFRSSSDTDGDALAALAGSFQVAAEFSVFGFAVRRSQLASDGIMSRLRTVAFTLVLTFCVPASAQDLVTPSNHVTTFVHVRAAAQKDAPQIALLKIGDALPLAGSIPRWYVVQLPNGQSGFVSKAWTSISRALVPPKEDELRIHYLNIGAGTYTVVECPGPNTPPIIVDCGSTGATSVDLDAAQSRTYVRNILSQHPTLPNVVLSHADLDHYGHISRTPSTT
jgi:beta-lactamase superfamily II metal-dependent hydrolase